MEFIPPIFMKHLILMEFIQFLIEDAFLRCERISDKRKAFSLEALQEQHFMQAYLRKQKRQQQVQILYVFFQIK